MRRLSFFALILVFGMTGCGLSEGTVYAKEYDDADTWVYMQPIYSTRCSGNGQCSTYVSGYVPVTQVSPECYRVEFRQGDETGSACVAPTEYDRINIGDHYQKVEQ